jgi:hypothetical protein
MQNFLNAVYCDIWRSHSGDYEDSAFSVVTACGQVTAYRHFREPCCLHHQNFTTFHTHQERTELSGGPPASTVRPLPTLRLYQECIDISAASSICPDDGAARFSKLSVYFYQTTRPYISAISHLYGHRREKANVRYIRISSVQTTLVLEGKLCPKSISWRQCRRRSCVL